MLLHLYYAWYNDRLIGVVSEQICNVYHISYRRISLFHKFDAENP